VVFAQEAVERPGAATPVPPVPHDAPTLDTSQTIAEPVGTAGTIEMEPVTAPITALSAAVAVHGGRAEVLADGSVVVTVLGEGTPTAQAARAARGALAVRQIVPDAPMALASGRCVVGDRAPFGELIDRAAGLLRTPVIAMPPLLPIRVDEVSAGLLDIRFQIEGDDAGLMLVGERDVADPVRTLLGKPTPCVGRGRELATLQASLEQRAGRPT